MKSKLVLPLLFLSILVFSGCIMDNFRKDHDSGQFFSGNIDYDGNINFKFGWTITPHAETYVSSRTVSGKKQ
jgi:hypothetical protein